MRPGSFRAFFRLLAVQASWNYERMTGVGLGYAAEPLLEDLKEEDPTRHAEASVRSAEYFNSHPYLAGVGLGALVRAEYDQVPGAQISRLRAALCSPLGALGDQLFWIGLVPAIVGAAILGVVWGLGVWAVVVAVVGYNAIRLATTAWGLRLGLSSGARVGAAIGESWLPGAAARLGLLAGALIGLALPLASDWLLADASEWHVVVAVTVMLVGLGAGWRLSPRVTSVRFAVAILAGAFLLAWGLR